MSSDTAPAASGTNAAASRDGAASEDGTRDKGAFLAELRAFEGRALGEPQIAPDAVNQAMIRHWCEAIGDENPVYTDPAAAADSVHGGVVAPPVMLQAWVMRGVRPRPTGGGNQQDELMRLLDEAGFTSVVATNCDQEYFRYLRPGDQLSQSASIESVSEEKRTALGVGHFVTTRSDYRDQSGDLVGTMVFRILKFRPPSDRARATAGDAVEEAAGTPRAERTTPPRPRPAITRDNAFFFDAAREGKLVIQRCVSCGRLRHPPRPACPYCRSYEWDAKEASGRGTVHSFVVNHHPQVAAFDYPLVVALIELEEGTRLVSNIVGVEPAEVRIGMPVMAEMVAFDEELTLPQFRPIGADGSVREGRLHERPRQTRPTTPEVPAPG